MRIGIEEVLTSVSRRRRSRRGRRKASAGR
jgi:hypothetical protein